MPLESDCYGACGVNPEALFMQYLVKLVGMSARIVLELDVSSAIAIGSRRSRPIEAQGAFRLWLPGLVSARRVTLEKVVGITHDPDICTAYVGCEQLEERVRRIGPQRAADIEGLGDIGVALLMSIDGLPGSLDLWAPMAVAGFVRLTGT